MNKRHETKTDKKTKIVVGEGKIIETITTTNTTTKVYLKNSKKIIKGIKPKFLEHKLYIDEYIDESGIGWDWFTSCDFDNYIITSDSNRCSDFINTRYEREYNAVCYFLENGIDDYQDAGTLTKWNDIYYRPHYETKTECLNAYMGYSHKWTKEECIKVSKILNNSKCSLNYDNELIVQILTIYTGRAWKVDYIKGYSQGEYAEVIHCGYDDSNKPYSKDYIDEIEAFYFGGYFDYNVTYKNHSCSYFYTDREKAINDFMSEYGIKNRNNVVFNGYY